ncbi:MAG: CrcB family protein [Pseudoclavibacter sp.]|jgi:CrcB protein
MMVFILACLAGGAGSVARFFVDAAISRRSRLPFPVGTIVVNVTACLFLGVFTGWAARTGSATSLQTVLGTGLLGGYSTFSTASLEGYRLLRSGRSWTALTHAGGMLILAVGAGLLGLSLG